jgi:hypothetical protein
MANASVRKPELVGFNVICKGEWETKGVEKQSFYPLCGKTTTRIEKFQQRINAQWLSLMIWCQGTY